MRSDDRLGAAAHHRSRGHGDETADFRPKLMRIGVIECPATDGGRGSRGRLLSAAWIDMDAANIDLKGFTEPFYKSLCSAQLAPVLDTLAYSSMRRMFGSKSRHYSSRARTTHPRR